MNIKIKYLGVYTANLHLDIVLSEGSTIKDMLHIISDKVGDPIDVLIKYAVFIVNGSKVNMNTVLNEKDNVLILYSLGGG